MKNVEHHTGKHTCKLTFLVVASVITFQSYKILTLSITNCSAVLASVKPSNSLIYNSNWTSWIVISPETTQPPVLYM